MKLIPDSEAFHAINNALNFDTTDGYFTCRLESYSCKMVGQEKALYKKFSSDDAGLHELLALSPPPSDAADYQHNNVFRSQSVPSSIISEHHRANLLLSSSNSTGESMTTVTDGHHQQESNSDEDNCFTSVAASTTVNNATSGRRPESSNEDCFSSADGVALTGGRHYNSRFGCLSPISNTDSPFSSADVDGSGGQDDTIRRKTLFYLVSTLNAAFFPDYDFSNSSSREFSKEHSLQDVMQSVERQLQLVSQTQLLPLTEQLWLAIDEAIKLCQCEIYTYNPDENSDPYSDDGCVWSFNYFFYNRPLKRIVFFSCRLVSSIVPDSAIGYSHDSYIDPDMDFDY